MSQDNRQNIHNYSRFTIGLSVSLIVVIMASCCWLLSLDSSPLPQFGAARSKQAATTNQEDTDSGRFTGHTPYANLSEISTASRIRGQSTAEGKQRDLSKAWRVRCRVGNDSAPGGIQVRAELRGVQGSETTLDVLERPTDSSGTATFARPTSLESLTSLLVGVSTDKWASLRRLSLGDFRTADDQGSYIADLTLVPVVRVLLDVVYADGEPYDGVVRFAQSGTDRSVLAIAGRTEFPAIPADDTIAIAKTNRPGYVSLFKKLASDEIQDNGLIRLILNRTRGPMSGLIVTAPPPPVEGVPVDVSLAVTFVDVGRNIRSGRMPLRPDKGLKYENHQLLPGHYEVTARKGEYVAFARALLQPDQVAEVELEWTACASVRATVIAPDGRPAVGAVLRYPVGPYVTFPARSTRNGLWAVANKEGVATLSGIAAREQAFLVEAEGCEVYELRVSPLQHATVDVRCELKPATGRIVVELANAVEDGKYVVSYRRPGTGTQDQDIEIRTGYPLVIDKIPRRRYSVIAKGGENGPIAVAGIDLSLTENGEAHVFLDVGHLTSR